MENLTTRQEFRTVTGVRLPFYVRSVGLSRRKANTAAQITSQDSDYVSLLWCAAGSGEATIFNQKFPFFPNDVIYYLPNEERRYLFFEQGCEYYQLSLDGPLACAFMLSYGYSRRLANAGKVPVKLFEELSAILCENDPRLMRHSVAIATEIIGLAGTACSPELSSGLLVTRFKEIVQARFGDAGLNINVICEELGCHRTTLDRAIKEKLNRTPINYLMSERCVYALALIRGTNLPIAEIAARCGIPDPATFNRFIRKYVGRSPLAYRRDAR